MSRFFDRFFSMAEWLISPWAQGSINRGTFFVLFIGAGAIRYYGLGLRLYARKMGDPAR